MTRSARLLTTTFLGIAAVTLAAPASAQAAGPAAGQDAVEARDAATYAALLAALLERRAVIVAAEMPAADKRKALEFLDTRIAKLKAQSGS